MAMSIPDHASRDFEPFTNWPKKAPLGLATGYHDATQFPRRAAVY